MVDKSRYFFQFYYFIKAGIVPGCKALIVNALGARGARKSLTLSNLRVGIFGRKECATQSIFSHSLFHSIVRRNILRHLHQRPHHIGKCFVTNK
jgi:hypothetical protein